LPVLLLPDAPPDAPPDGDGDVLFFSLLGLLPIEPDEPLLLPEPAVLPLPAGWLPAWSQPISVPANASAKTTARIRFIGVALLSDL
jgi:hypothetical protein